jgi:hypothetical protein
MTKHDKSHLPANCQFQRVLDSLRSSIAIPGLVCALILGKGSELYDRICRVKLESWLYILPGPVQCAEVSSASLLGNRKAKTTSNP